MNASVNNGSVGTSHRHVLRTLTAGVSAVVLGCAMFVSANVESPSVGLALGCTMPVSPAHYTSTGAQQCFVVPAGVTAIQATLVGGIGGSGAVPYVGPARGGYGAAVSAVIDVTPAETLYIEVGGNGQAGIECVNTCGTAGAGGFNGGGYGGAGFEVPAIGGGGGGATDIQTQPMPSACPGSVAAFNSRLLVAGGGGGGGDAGRTDLAGTGGPGGSGGSTAAAGQSGSSGFGDGGGGSGGTATAGGTGGAGGTGPVPARTSGQPGTNGDSAVVGLEAPARRPTLGQLVAAVAVAAHMAVVAAAVADRRAIPALRAAVAAARAAPRRLPHSAT